MKYYLINPVFNKEQMLITNNHAIYEIETEIKHKNATIKDCIFIKVNRMIFKLIINEINNDYCKLELTSNVYV